MLTFYETDPEFTKRFEHFAFDEVPNEPGQQLPETDRWLAILAALMAQEEEQKAQPKKPAAAKKK